MSRLRVVSAVLATVLALGLGARVAARDAGPPPSLAARLAGPFGGLFASAQWVRVQEAAASGRHGLAFARAELALRLDPARAAGWEIVAAHQGLYLASPPRVPDPDRRRAWLAAALETCRRGEDVTRDPAALAWFRGLLLRTRAADEVPLHPVEELWEDAARAFDEAAALGHPSARSHATYAREQLP